MIKTPHHIAGYKMETLVAGVSHDWVGGHNLTMSGGNIVAGKFGNGTNFDGVDDIGTIADSNDFTFANGTNDLPFTISFYVKFAVNNVPQWLISKRIQGVGEEWQLSYYFTNPSDARIYFTLYSQNNPSNAIFIQSNIFQPAINQWYLIQVTYAGSSTKEGLNMYINYVSHPNKFLNGTYVRMQNTTANVLLGTFNGNAFLLKGVMDELNIYTKELSLNDLKRVGSGLHPLNG